MKKYEVKITADIRSIQFSVEVEADSPEEALKIVKEKMDDNWYGQTLMTAAEGTVAEIESVEVVGEV